MSHEMNERILKVIEKNSRLTAEEIAIMLGLETDDVVHALKDMEERKIICGYHTLVNWDKANDDEVSAVIELKVNPQRGAGFDKIAERVYQFPEVDAVYLMSGAYDLLVEMRKAPMKDIASFVARRLSTIEEVQSTATHFILKRYKDHGTLFVDEDKDKRMVVSP
ncbi:Lrp/AsnC family transcriptional regulator [Jeotgalibaca porci]|jgi:DNA-binding Lrp family transcriptional regulator|uniref:Lrp/AsnC family transcriptional regulator n=3 Tax=Carnobacteriaceae TaxID=186828 RepID=A0A6G7K8M7_9LACT|nr:Lrp/AsnC family transcriptional regulator [Jeotgalibaca arthritidis]HJA90668.1 Lrp/AsnC family transcriptional regulator [Candidatus Jeotgalibaca merdavium]